MVGTPLQHCKIVSILIYILSKLSVSEICSRHKKSDLRQRQNLFCSKGNSYSLYECMAIHLSTHNRIFSEATSQMTITPTSTLVYINYTLIHVTLNTGQTPWGLYIIALLYFPADIPTQARRGALSSWPSRAAAVIGTDTNLHLYERFSVQEVNALFLAVQQAVQLTQPCCCTASPSAAVRGPILLLCLYSSLYIAFHLPCLPHPLPISPPFSPDPPHLQLPFTKE